MIKYNNNNIVDWNLASDNIVKVYRNGILCYQKMAESVTPPTPPTPSGTTAITYIASWKLDVVASRFTPNASAETYDNATSAGTIYFPSDVTSIGASAFYRCSSLTSITIPSSVTSIGNKAFEYCSGLTSVTIPNSVTSIGDSTFTNCFGIISATIGSGVTSIGIYAFSSCGNLTSVTIPNSVTSIGNKAFSWCSDLTSVTVNAVTPPTLGSSVFDNTNNCPIYVPSSSVNTYKSASGWSDYADRIQAIS